MWVYTSAVNVEQAVASIAGNPRLNPLFRYTTNWAFIFAVSNRCLRRITHNYLGSRGQSPLFSFVFLFQPFYLGPFLAPFAHIQIVDLLRFWLQVLLPSSLFLAASSSSLPPPLAFSFLVLPCAFVYHLLLPHFIFLQVSNDLITC